MVIVSPNLPRTIPVDACCPLSSLFPLSKVSSLYDKLYDQPFQEGSEIYGWSVF